MNNLIVEISEPLPGKLRGDCPVASCPWHLYSTDPNVLQASWEKHTRKAHEKARR